MPYAKIQDDIVKRFQEHGVSPIARHIYLAMASMLYHNSAIAKSTYGDIMEATGITSPATIRKYLKELGGEDKKKSTPFIQKISESNYLLFYSVFKGIKEKQIHDPPEGEKHVCQYPPELQESARDQISGDDTSPGEVSEAPNTSRREVPHAGVPFNQQSKKHRHDAVFFKDLKFGENSRFKDEIGEKQWIKWIRRHRFDDCQNLIKDLEWAYRDNPAAIRNPGALIQQGLTDDWQIQKRRLAAAKKHEAECEAKKEQERRSHLAWERETVERDSQYDQDDADYNEAIKDPYIVRKTREKMGDKLDERLESHRIQLKHNIIKKYRELREAVR